MSTLGCDGQTHRTKPKTTLELAGIQCHVLSSIDALPEKGLTRPLPPVGIQ